MFTHQNRLDYMYTCILKENRKDIPIMSLDHALWLILSSSNYPCFEHIVIITKLFEPLKYGCIYSQCIRYLVLLSFSCCIRSTLGTQHWVNVIQRCVSSGSVQESINDLTFTLLFTSLYLFIGIYYKSDLSVIRIPLCMYMGQKKAIYGYTSVMGCPWYFILLWYKVKSELDFW